MTKNALFLDTITGNPGSRPPVWFMRQAGRSLPSYQQLKEKYTFKEMMNDPQLTSDVTLLPVWDLGVDAAILFSDILVIPESLGMFLKFEGTGPKFSDPLAFRDNPLENLEFYPESLEHIYEGIKIIIKEKPAEVALIGFAGGPFTVLCYMLQGISQNHAFPDAINFIFQRPEETWALLDIITEATIHYAKQQVAAGIDAFQIFETHAGLIPSAWFEQLIIPRIKRIAQAVKETGTPVIFFPRGFGFGLKNLDKAIGDFVGIDWQADIYQAREVVVPDLGIQGNLDPRILLANKAIIEQELEKYKDFGACNRNWIFNLGHGILPNTPVENIKFTVDWIKNTDWKRG
ncbi:MAG: uroporphyrinogen decarboxylase [Bacteroidota bacterium]